MRAPRTFTLSSAASNTLSTEEFLLESIYHFIYPFRSQIVGIFLVDEQREYAILRAANTEGGTW